MKQDEMEAAMESFGGGSEEPMHWTKQTTIQQNHTQEHINTAGQNVWALPTEAEATNLWTYAPPAEIETFASISHGILLSGVADINTASS